jgi:predicted Zn-dependent protease
MQVFQALVSGSLGQALFLAEGALHILDAPDAEPRQTLPNEGAWFRHKARQVALVDPNGLPVSMEQVRRRLSEEIHLFNALDGLLVGMDRDFSEDLRKRSILRAEHLLVRGGDFAKEVRERFLIPVNTQEWDPAGGLEKAVAVSAGIAASCYRPLADGIIDHLADDISAAVIARLGTDIEAFRHRERIIRSGLLAELALIESRRDRQALSKIVFRRQHFPKLRTSDPSGQILANVVRRVEMRLRQTSDAPTVAPATGERDVEPDDVLPIDTADPIIAAIERAVEIIEDRKGTRRKGSMADLPGIQREIEWIGQRLKTGQVPRAEHALLTLIKRQSERSRVEDIAKTLTAVADLARIAGEYDWTWRVLAALDYLGASDAAVLNVRAQMLRETGRRDEALGVLQESMRRFPQNEAVRNAYAEALREVGRREEALTVLKETMRRFPHDEVARNAFAEALRELGRREEALTVLEETMRRFPGDEVAPTAYAEILREAGRHDEALRVLEETMRRFPQDEVAPTAYAEALRELGRLDEALTIFQETMRRFPHNEVAPTAYAEALREAGRGDEALAVFRETMRRFPHNEVAPTAYAEVLREADRSDEALAVLQDTIRRFPHSEFARTCYAHALASSNRVSEAEAILLPAASRLQTRHDWIALHILGMVWLKSKRVGEALDAFERGLKDCEIVDVRRYFATARPVALIAARRSPEAIKELEALGKTQSLNRLEAANIILFKAHAHAEAGDREAGKRLLGSAEIINFAEAKQKRLAMTLDKRYGFSSGRAATAAEAEKLNDDIASLESDLVRPKLWSLPIRNAA